MKILVCYAGAYFMGMMAARLYMETSFLPWVSVAFFVGGVTPWCALIWMSLREPPQ